MTDTTAAAASPEASTLPPANTAAVKRGPHPVLLQLAQLYPALFGATVQPLKRGIFQDLLAAHGHNQAAGRLVFSGRDVDLSGATTRTLANSAATRANTAMPCAR